ncbi:MAG: flavodoxin-dependent (E)-4-hydroxy-3-methylbut-2-enyl-diphosphate synthase [Candidatus Omnitrophota bacterium]
MQIKRRKTKTIKIGKVKIGSGHPIAVQSMTKTETEDIDATISQIHALEIAGCQIVRVAVKDKKDGRAIRRIRQNIHIPLVADIHFDYRLALEAIDSGVDKIRLNPGNIYKKEQIKDVARAAKQAKIPIRVGLNSGSLRNTNSRSLKAAHMVGSALDYIKILESFGFSDIVVSLKSSNIFDTIEAYRKMAKFCDYPFHLGVTATGLASQGIVKSSIGIGALLADGLGDTIRVSLTDDSIKEVEAAKLILEALNLAHHGLEIISCPTCGRCQVDLVKLVKEFQKRINSANCKLSTVNSEPFKVALMGCMVNGPGEAKEADLGIAFGGNSGILFKKGKIIKKAKYNQAVDLLVSEWRRLC